MFWSSADLTGNQTIDSVNANVNEFWSSADLTGNQTEPLHEGGLPGVLEQCRFNW